MKSLLFACLPLAAVLPASAAIVFSGTRNIAVSFDPNGTYLNIATGQTTGSEPADWETSPTINFFFGGVAIATDALLRPVADNDGRILNLTAGTVVDAALNFAGSPNGSETHIGAGSDQFQLDQPGYLAFSFKLTSSDPIPHYGWLRFTPSTGGGAIIESWGYETAAGQSIAIGAIPEPSAFAVAALSGIAFLGVRRRGLRKR